MPDQRLRHARAGQNVNMVRLNAVFSILLIHEATAGLRRRPHLQSIGVVHNLCWCSSSRSSTTGRTVSQPERCWPKRFRRTSHTHESSTDNPKPSLELEIDIQRSVRVVRWSPRQTQRHHKNIQKIIRTAKPVGEDELMRATVNLSPGSKRPLLCPFQGIDHNRWNGCVILPGPGW